MYPFERFTSHAKRVLTLAQEEAERAQHSYIGTEHLLLGLLRVEDGVAAQALTSLGIQIGEVRDVIAAVLGRNERIQIKQIIPTSRVKKVIEIAFGEAQRTGHPHVGTGQLLMGLVIEGEGIAAHVLKDMHAGRPQVEESVAEAEKVVSESGSSSAGGSVVEVPLGTGARVLVHDPEPPYRLWEGRVTGSGPGSLEVEVPDRPAGSQMSVDPMLVHPIPTGPTLYCKFCMHQ